MFWNLNIEDVGIKGMKKEKKNKKKSYRYIYSHHLLDQLLNLMFCCISLIVCFFFFKCWVSQVLCLKWAVRFEMIWALFYHYFLGLGLSPILEGPNCSPSVSPSQFQLLHWSHSPPAPCSAKCRRQRRPPLPAPALAAVRVARESSTPSCRRRRRRPRRSLRPSSRRVEISGHSSTNSVNWMVITGRLRPAASSERRLRCLDVVGGGRGTPPATRRDGPLSGCAGSPKSPRASSPSSGSGTQFPHLVDRYRLNNVAGGRLQLRSSRRFLWIQKLSWTWMLLKDYEIFGRIARVHRSFINWGICNL